MSCERGCRTLGSTATVGKQDEGIWAFVFPGTY